MDEAAIFFKLIGSFLYAESSEEDIAYMHEEQVFDDIPYAADNPLVKAGQRDIIDWLNSGVASESSMRASQLAEAAAYDYMKLFIGVGKVLAPPWGSCYLTEGRLVFQKETLEVREFYAEYDFQLKNKHSEPDDHIGLELEFLANLLEQEQIEPALRFMKSFMSPWIQDWLHDVEKSARTGFYKGLARMAVGGIECFLAEAKIVE